jgi:hypothetical protein
MKKLLFIICIFFSGIVYGQTTITNLGSNFTTLGIGVFSGVPFVSGRLYIFFVGVSNAGGTPATVTLSGSSQTWTEIAMTLNNSGNRRIYAFRYLATSSHSNQTDFSISGVQDGMFATLIGITGCVTTGTNGADAVVQSTTSNANGADPSLTLSAIANRGSVLTGFINERNAFGGTAESGWTGGEDNGYATPDTGEFVMWRISTTDNTPTVTSTSNNWGGIAIEIRAAGRRAAVIN